MADTQETQTEREFYPTVSAIIIHAGKVLLRRDQQRYNWLPVSTHIGINETPIDALFRQVHFETGLPHNNLTLLLPYMDNLSLKRDEKESTTQPLPFDVDIFREGNGVHHHVDFGYILVSNTNELTPEADTPPELQWFTRDELEELMMTSKATVSRSLYALQRYEEQPPEKS